MVGYESKVLPASAFERLETEITLQEEHQTLEEVAVLAKDGERYRNKDNPAVDLIRKVIDHKDLNYDQESSTAVFDKYEVLQVSLLRDRDKIKPGAAASTLSGMFERADTTKVTGKFCLPVMVHEKVWKVRGATGSEKAVTTLVDEQKTSLDGMIDDNGLEAYLQKIVADVDVYDNNILLGDQQLLSPLAGLAPEFYKYFITDTLSEGKDRKVKIAFYPRNKAGLLFKGELLVILDGTYAVTDVKLSLNEHINLNWIDNLNIALQYTRRDNGLYYQGSQVLGMKMSLFGKSGGFYGEKKVSVKHYRHPAPAVPDVLPGTTGITATQPLTAVQWEALRLQNGMQGVQVAYANLDTLKKTPAFKKTANILTLLLSGYEVLGPVEIGQFSSFYSYNPVEGSRFKLGGRTTDLFSKTWVLEGHAAYGLKDKQWKYNAGITYSLTGRSVYRYPVRAISISHSYETQIPGQDLMFMAEDNFLLSFKRGNNDKWLYNRKWSVNYIHEMENHLSFRIGFNHNVQSPAGSLSFNAFADGHKQTMEHITLAEIATELRWAPNEQFYQGKNMRRPVFNAYPVFTLRGRFGIKGLLDGGYNYQSITLNIFKRFYLSQLGFSDVAVEGGQLFGRVPYPLLYIPAANQSYAYQLYAYNLMNFMEFVSDRYVSLNIDHSFNGFLLNKVPLVKKLQLREVASFKALYGTLRNENDPSGNASGLFGFPTDDKGNRATRGMTNGPYLEGSIGISNIFKVLRVDVVKRFSYLDNPGISSWGIRGRIVLAL